MLTRYSSNYRSNRLFRFWSFLICLLALFSTTALAQSSDTETPPPHLDQARQLVAKLRHARENVYGGGRRHIDWDASDCSARTVCSSFITLLLQHTYGWKDAEIRTWLHSADPDAAPYHDAIVDRQRFKRILHMKALRPGDILAVKYTDHHVSRNGVEDTGHVMLVAGLPHPEESRKSTPGKKAFVVSIIDSSASGHGPQDTRAKQNGRLTGGIGQGEIRLYADQEDRIIGYTWSTLASSPYYSGPDRDIVAGRLTDTTTR